MARTIRRLRDWLTGRRLDRTLRRHEAAADALDAALREVLRT